MIYVILVFAAIAFFSIHPLIKQKRWHDFIMVSLMYAATLTICLLVEAGVKLPSLSMAFADLLKSIGLYYPPLE